MPFEAAAHPRPQPAKEPLEFRGGYGGELLVGGLWSDLVAQAIPPEHRRPDLGGVIFQLIRGLAIGSNLMEAIPYANRPRSGGDPREVLVQALSLYVAAV